LFVYSEYFVETIVYSVESWQGMQISCCIICTTSRTDTIYLYSDICGESIVEGENRPLLRRLPASAVGNWLTIVETPFYVPIKNNNIYDIDIYITTDQNNFASFLDQPSTSTLHLKSFPFFWVSDYG